MSGAMYRPCRQKLSPTFEMIVNWPTSSLRPLSSLADPVPPARTVSFNSDHSLEQVRPSLPDDASHPGVTPFVAEAPDHGGRRKRVLAHHELRGGRYLVYDSGLRHPQG